MYNPSKPGKICVVFDCSAEYQRESIDKESLSGLTNQVIGVLTTLREEKIAFMADIEAMYHKVQVLEDQYSFLEFLWWKNHDMDREPHEPHLVQHCQPAVQILTYVGQSWKMKPFLRSGSNCSSSQFLCR